MSEQKWVEKGGSGLWREHVNSQTGESSIRDHKLKKVGEWCDPEKHLYDGSVPQDRQITCIVCGQTRTFVLGFHDFNDGRLTYRSKS